MSIIKYFREVREELKKVSWPSRESAFRMTLTVIAASIGVGIYIGGLDYLFTNLLGLFLK